MVDTVDTCTTTLDKNPPIDMGPAGATVSVAGVYCRPLNTRARCEGSNLYGDVDGSTDSTTDPLVNAPDTRPALAWTTTSLEMHMCTSTSTSVKI